MKIKMPVKFHGNYRVTIRQGEWETRERCQKLVVRELTPSEKEQYYKQMDENDTPTHQVSFFDFGCRRIIEGKLTANEEEQGGFRSRGKRVRVLTLQNREIIFTQASTEKRKSLP